MSILIRATICLLMTTAKAKCPPKFVTWDREDPVNIEKRETAAKTLVIKDARSRSCRNTPSCKRLLNSIQGHDKATLKYPAIDCNFIIDSLGSIYEGRGWRHISSHYSRDALVICMFKSNTVYNPNKSQQTSLINLTDCGKKLNFIEFDAHANTPRSLPGQEQHKNPNIELQFFLDVYYGCIDGFYGEKCEKICPTSCSKKKCRGPEGECICPGYKNGCQDPCQKGTWGHECQETCPPKCNQGPCNELTGDCKECITGYMGVHCDKACDHHAWGPNCKYKCPDNCNKEVGSCNKETGGCQECENGFKGLHCDETCEQGKWGHNCKHRCPDNCNKEVGSCNRVTGECQGCKKGFKGSLCNEPCTDGTWGHDCLQKCAPNCNQEVGPCDKFNGECKECISGYMGMHCDEVEETMCPVTCLNNKCDRSTRTCTQGCKPGYYPPSCDIPCPIGFYGQNCKEECTLFCVGSGACYHITGYCFEGCSDGHDESRKICPPKDSGCPIGKWGKKCNATCSDNCAKYHIKPDTPVCHVDLGDCLFGCQPGFRGRDCSSACPNGTYGSSCAHVCSKYCAGGGMCSHVDGTCFDGCVEERYGKICHSPIPDPVLYVKKTDFFLSEKLIAHCLAVLEEGDQLVWTLKGKAGGTNRIIIDREPNISIKVGAFGAKYSRTLIPINNNTARLDSAIEFTINWPFNGAVLSCSALRYEDGIFVESSRVSSKKINVHNPPELDALFTFVTQILWNFAALICTALVMPIAFVLGTFIEDFKEFTGAKLTSEMHPEDNALLREPNISDLTNKGKHNVPEQTDGIIKRLSIGLVKSIGISRTYSVDSMGSYSDDSGGSDESYYSSDTDSGS